MIVQTPSWMGIMLGLRGWKGWTGRRWILRLLQGPASSPLGFADGLPIGSLGAIMKAPAGNTTHALACRDTVYAATVMRCCVCNDTGLGTI